MFENRVLRKIFGHEVTGEWRKLHNEELRDLYSSPSIIRIMKSRRMRWAGHVTRMGEKRNAYRLLGNGFQRRTFPFLCVLELSSASHISQLQL
jgi:hypothetical protein